MLRESVVKYIDENREEYVKLLGKLVELETVSAWKTSSEMESYAREIAYILRERGFKTVVEGFGGHPLIYGELGKGSIEVAIYNHYDVQPPDPLDKWVSNPFKLVERNGSLFGRGVADNKGNIAARLAAIDALEKYIDNLDLKIKYVIEGEEEIGSPTLDKAARARAEWFKARGGFWETGYVGRDGRLSIPLGFKGMVYVEVVFRGPRRDLHSGSSPIVPNPIWRLVHFLSLLRDRNGRITADWVFEGIKPLEEAVKLIRELDPRELEEFKKEIGIAEFVEGASGYEALEKLYLMPSVNVSGIYGGYGGPGSKTVIPSIAGAKIDIRLVPGQKPERILELFKEFVEEHGFGDAKIVVHGSYPAGYTKPSEAIVKASVYAGELVYGNKPRLIPVSAGSGPIYVYTELAGTPMTGSGVGYYGSKAHAPNENIRFKDFVNGMKHVALTILEFVKILGESGKA